MPTKLGKPLSRKYRDGGRDGRNKYNLPDKKFIKIKVNDMEQERNNWDPVYKDIRDYIAPQRGQFEDRNPNNGKRYDDSLVDLSPLRASRILSAGMHAGFTSPSRPWFRLATSDPDLNKFHSVKMYLSEVTKRMREVFSASNIYNVFPHVYSELGNFATAGMHIEPDFENVIRCIPYTIGSYSLMQDSSLRINGYTRQINWQAHQIVDRFPKSNIPKTVIDAYNRGDMRTWFKVYHYIGPNEHMEPNKMDWHGKPFVSLYWLDGSTDHDAPYLRVSGYNDFPAMFPRWGAVGTDVYGSESPGWLAIGDSKMLQTQQGDKLEASDKILNPPLNVPNALKNNGVNILPGGMNYYDGVPQGGIRPVYEVSPNLADMRENIIDTRQSIKEAFFADLFLMMATSDRREITAREVAERHEEKLLMLGPVVERIEDELLDKVIARTFNIMGEAGILPEPPKELQGVDIKVEYISMLSTAQKMVGVTALEQFTGYVGNLAAVKPEALSKINVFGMVNEYGDMLGVDPSIIIPDDEAQAAIQAQIQQQQAKDMMEMAQQGAGAAKDLGKVDVGGNTALNALLKGMV